MEKIRIRDGKNSVRDKHPGSATLVWRNNIIILIIVQVVVNKEDVDLIVNEMEIPRERADRTLREHGGDVVKALCALVNS